MRQKSQRTKVYVSNQMEVQCHICGLRGFIAVADVLPACACGGAQRRTGRMIAPLVAAEYRSPRPSRVAEDIYKVLL